MYNPFKKHEKKELHDLSVRWQQLFLEREEVLQRREKALQDMTKAQNEAVELYNEMMRIDSLRNMVFTETQNKPGEENTGSI